MTDNRESTPIVDAEILKASDAAFESTKRALATMDNPWARHDFGLGFQAAVEWMQKLATSKPSATSSDADRVRELEEDLKNMQYENTSLKCGIQDYDDEVARLKSRIGSLVSEVEFKRKVIVEMREELGTLRSSAPSLNLTATPSPQQGSDEGLDTSEGTALVHALKLAKQYQDKIAALEKELAEVTAEYTKWIHRLAALRKERDDLSKRVEDLKSENSRLRELMEKVAALCPGTHRDENENGVIETARKLTFREARSE